MEISCVNIIRGKSNGKSLARQRFVTRKEKFQTMRGRFAPSPSGKMHLGNAWTALLAWIQVRKAGGTMALRIEDLDPDRSKYEYTVQLMEDLSWLGLDWDEGPDKGGPRGSYRQDERRSLYNEIPLPGVCVKKAVPDEGTTFFY